MLGEQDMDVHCERKKPALLVNVIEEVDDGDPKQHSTYACCSGNLNNTSSLIKGTIQLERDTQAQSVLGRQMFACSPGIACRATVA